MRLSDISLRNLRRRRSHTLFLVLSLVVAVATVVTVISVTSALNDNVKSKLREYGANMVVSPRSMEVALTYGGITLGDISVPVEELTEEDAIKIATIRRKDALRGISPKLVGAVEAEGQRFVLVGVRFRDELRLKPWWRMAGEEPATSRDLLLGSQVSRQLRKEPGDTLDIGGKTFRVAGVLEEQLSQEDGVVFADLREAGLLLGKPGKVSLIEVSSWCAACPIDIVVEQISAKLPHARVMAIQQLVQAELGQVELVTRFSWVLCGVVLFIGSLIVLITMMASVTERTHEIGVFRALGFRQSHIIRIIMLEGVIIGLLGGGIGVAVGGMAAWLLSGPVAGLEIPALVRPEVALLGMVLAVVMGTLPTIYPALRAAQLDPTAALRAL
ncbi:MAG: ABC transporter permease [Chloroflexota bacterium]|nr:ABC transporter permease [Chloroflexota bacterium]